MPNKAPSKNQKLLKLAELHNCDIHLRRYVDGQYLATYSYDWGDAHCRFTLLSEVAERLIETFQHLTRKRGLEQAGSRFTKERPFAQDILVPNDKSPAGRRWLQLLPGGLPRWIRCYDNGGRSCDRYTVVFSGRAAVDKGGPGRPNQYPYLAMSADPFHPQGFGQHGWSDYTPCDTPKGTWPPPVGRKNHLGKRIGFLDLPPDCQRLVFENYLAIWKL